MKTIDATCSAPLADCPKLPPPAFVAFGLAPEMQVSEQHKTANASTHLCDSELHTLALGQRDLGLGALANDENVGESKFSF